MTETAKTVNAAKTVMKAAALKLNPPFPWSWIPRFLNWIPWISRNVPASPWRGLLASAPNDVFGARQSWHAGQRWGIPIMSDFSRAMGTRACKGVLKAPVCSAESAPAEGQQQQLKTTSDVTSKFPWCSRACEPWSANRELRGWQKRGCRDRCQKGPEKGAWTVN